MLCHVLGYISQNIHKENQWKRSISMNLQWDVRRAPWWRKGTEGSWAWIGEGKGSSLLNIYKYKDIYKIYKAYYKGRVKIQACIFFKLFSKAWIFRILCNVIDRNEDLRKRKKGSWTWYSLNYTTVRAAHGWIIFSLWKLWRILWGVVCQYLRM